MPNSIGVDELFADTKSVSSDELFAPDPKSISVDDLFGSQAQKRYDAWVKNRGKASALRGLGSQLAQQPWETAKTLAGGLGAVVSAPLGYAKHWVDVAANKSAGLPNSAEPVPAQDLVADALYPTKENALPGELAGRSPYEQSAYRAATKLGVGFASDPMAMLLPESKVLQTGMGLSALKGSAEELKGAYDLYKKSGFSPEVLEQLLTAGGSGALGAYLVKSGVKLKGKARAEAEPIAEKAPVENAMQPPPEVWTGEAPPQPEMLRTPEEVRIESMKAKGATDVYGQADVVPGAVPKEAPSVSIEELFSKKPVETFKPEALAELDPMKDLPPEPAEALKQFPPEEAKPAEPTMARVERGLATETDAVPMPGEPGALGAREGVVKYGPDGTPEPIAYGKSSSAYRAKHNAEQIPTPPEGGLEAPVSFSSTPGSPFQTAESIVARKNAVRSAAGSEGGQYAINYAQKVFDTVKGDTHLVDMEAGPEFKGWGDHVLESGRSAIGGTNDLGGITHNPVEATVESNRLLRQKPEQYGNRGKLLQARINNNIAHEMAHANDNLARHSKTNEAITETGWTANERFHRGKELTDSLTSTSRKKLMQFGDRETWNKVYDELLGHAKEIYRTNPKKGVEPKFKSVEEALANAKAKGALEEPTSAIEAMKELDKVREGGQEGSVATDLLLAPVLAAKAIGKKALEFVRDGGLRGTWQASLAGGLKTALNNFYNSGVRYAALGTMIDVLGSPISSTSRGQLLGKGKALTELMPNLIDTLKLSAGVESPKSASFNNAKVFEGLVKDNLPKTIGDRFFHLFSNEVAIPVGGSRKLNLSEKIQKGMMIASLVQERSVRLAVSRAEMEPFMREHGVKSYGELSQRMAEDKGFRDQATDALTHSITMGLDISSALPPMHGKHGGMESVTRLIKNFPGSFLMMPFTDYMLANMPQQMLEANLLTMMASKRMRESAKYPTARESLAASEAKQAELKQRADLTEDQADYAAASKHKATVVYPKTQALKKMQRYGVKSPNQMVSMAMTGPLVVAMYAAYRLHKGEDDTEYYQVKGNGEQYKDHRGILGPLNIYALMGDYIGRNAIDSKKYSSKEHYQNYKMLAETLTQTRFGGTDVTSLVPLVEKMTSDATWEDTIKKLGFSWGQVLGKGGAPGDLARLAANTMVPGETTARTYTGDKKHNAFKEGMMSQIPGMKQDLPVAYNATSGEERKTPEEPLGELGPYPSTIKTIDPVEKFLQRHSQDLDRGKVLMPQTHVPDYDRVAFDYYRKILEKKIVPLLEKNIPEDVKVQKFQQLMIRARDTATVRAKEAALKEGFMLPQSVAIAADEAAKRLKIAKENPGLFPRRTPRKPAQDRLSKVETKKLQKKAQAQLDEDDDED